MELKNPAHNIKIIQLAILFLGFFIMGSGFYLSGDRLVPFVLRYSPDRILREETVTFLYSLRGKIILWGFLLALSGIFLRYFLLLENFITRNVRSNIDKFILFLGRLINLIYRIMANKRVVWLVLIIIFITFAHSSVYYSPSGWHSEGINLQPPKNLVKHGVYATLTTQGYDEFTYRISSGPGMLLPTALMFKIFGISMINAKILIWVFIALQLFLFYYISRKLYGEKIALLALVFLLFTPSGDVSPLGGQMAGTAYHVASVYLMIGALFWFKSIETAKTKYLFLASLCWAFSFQSQWLFLFAIFAAILTWFIVRFSDKPIAARYWIIPSLTVILITGGWFSFRVSQLGITQEYRHLLRFKYEHGHRALGTATQEGVIDSALSFIRPIKSLAQIDLWKDLNLFLFVPALLYVLILIARSKMTDYRSIFFLNFTLIWFAWWLLFNFDLPETHLFGVFMFSQLFIAKLIYDLWNYSVSRRDNFLDLVKNETRDNTIFYLVRVGLICIVLLKIILPMARSADRLYRLNLTLTRPYTEMMNHVQNHTEENAIFSGWRWSLPWYVDLDNHIDRINKDRSTYPAEQREHVPEYFIVSPEWPLVKATDKWPMVDPESNFSVEQNKMRKKFLEQHCSLLETFGNGEHKWLLYRVNNDKLP